MRKEIVTLKHTTISAQRLERGGGIVWQGLIIHQHRARLRQQQDAEHAQHGGFPAAAGPEQRNDMRVATGLKTRAIQRGEMQGQSLEEFLGEL